MKFLFDNNLSPHLARGIGELSRTDGDRVKTVAPLRDKFPPDTPDIQWLTQLDREGGWCTVSGDNFRKGDAERELVRRAGFTVFVLHKRWSNHPYWNKAAQLVLWWPHIVEQSERVTRSALRVPWRTSGKFEQIRL